MQSSFDEGIHAACEEDLIFPDEGKEFLSELEYIEQKKEKFERRRLIKDITR